MSRCEHAKTELTAERVELLSPRLRAGSVGGQGVGAEPQLLRHEAQRGFRNHIAWSQQAAWIAEGAEL
jgi:hypothetical protein